MVTQVVAGAEGYEPYPLRNYHCGRPQNGNTTYRDENAVANLWTDFAAHDCYAMSTNGKECENPSRSLVAATFEKAKAYVFAVTQVRDREVGDSTVELRNA